MVETLRKRKQEIIEELKKTNLDFEEWRDKIEGASKLSDLTTIEDGLIFHGKKEFLIYMIKKIKKWSKDIESKIDECNTLECLDSISHVYALDFFKKQLLEDLIKEEILNENHPVDKKKINRILSFSSIENIINGNKRLLATLNLKLEKRSAFLNSLYGSEYISTTKSVRAILIGMIY